VINTIRLLPKKISGLFGDVQLFQIHGGIISDRKQVVSGQSKEQRGNDFRLTCRAMQKTEGHSTKPV
jgi:hypothetical protein